MAPTPLVPGGAFVTKCLVSVRRAPGAGDLPPTVLQDLREGVFDEAILWGPSAVGERARGVGWVEPGDRPARAA